jgi:polyisoprenoid-binding protein YceI
MKKYLTGCFTFALMGMLCLAPNAVRAQGTLYSTTSGVTSFSASTPLENIEAENKKSQAAFNTATGDIAVRMNMRDFVFPNKLMQEHFNENYIESEKFPTATFSGKVTKTIDYTKDGSYDLSASGKFTVHGVSKDRTINGKVTVSGGKLTIDSEFEVLLVDHKIEVPSIVFVKIAQNIRVKAQYVLAPKK